MSVAIPIPLLQHLPDVNVSLGVAPSGNASSVPSISTNSNARENRTTVNNITVQTIDSESAARAVAKVINESAARSIPSLSGTSVRGN